MRTLRVSRFARLVGLGLAMVAVAALAPLPVAAQKKEIIQLQQDVTRLLQAQRDLQRSVDEKHAILKTLIEQQMDATTKLNITMGGLQKAIQDVQANSGARTDSLATQVQALADNFEEIKVRAGRLSQQLAEMQGVLQSLDAKLSGGAPQPGTGNPPPASSPPPPSDVLYSNGLRDFTSGKYELARQEFLDYLRYYPETDYASNCQFYLGEIFYAQRMYKEAVTEYDRVLDNYPKSFKLADARLKKGLALLELGQRAGAQRELREVVRRHPGSEAARRANAKLRELSGGSPGE